MTAHRNRESRRRRTGSALRVEALEQRLCLASSASLLNDGTLLILGDNRANQFQIVDGGAGTVGVIGRFDAFGDGAYEDEFGEFDALFDEVARIVIDTKGGSDTVEYRLSDVLVTSREVVMDLGSGNDSVIVDVDAVDGADLILSADLGRGNDRFDAAFFGDLIDAYVQMDVDGGAGHDDLLVATNPVYLDDVSTLDMVLDGGSGNDGIAVNVELDDTSTGTLYLSALGNRGNDDLEMNVFGVDFLTEVSELVLDGGPGRDRYTATSEVVIFNLEPRPGRW